MYFKITCYNRVMGSRVDSLGSVSVFVVGLFENGGKFILGNFLIGRLFMSLSTKCVGQVPAVLYSVFRFWKRGGEI
jgi:hypothetical protein